jgi:hypothetical protein
LSIPLWLLIMGSINWRMPRRLKSSANALFNKASGFGIAVFVNSIRKQFATSHRSQTSSSHRLWPLLALNFFMADMQSSIGPFLGVFLLSRAVTRNDAGGPRELAGSIRLKSEFGYT